MAITSLDGVVAGAQWPRFIAKAITPTMVAGRMQSLWGLGGNPSAGTFNTTLAGVTLNSTSAQVPGQIDFTNPVSGNAYLARFSASINTSGLLILADRIWHNGGFTINSTALQTVNSVGFPARDNNGTSAGEGILLGLEISAAAGAAAPTITIGYTNSNGVAGRIATNSAPTANSPGAGAFYPIGLQSGDIGVRSVQSLQLSGSWISGTMNLVAYRPIATLEISSSFAGFAIDAISSGMPILYPGSVPQLIMIPSAATASGVTGSVVWTHG
jgi:hypothetical protein